VDSTIDTTPLTESELRDLYRPEADPVREAYEDAVLVLEDLFRRYTGSWFGVQIPEEEKAIELLETSLGELPEPHPLRDRVVRTRRAYEALRQEVVRAGASNHTQEAARKAVDALSDQLAALTEYPLEPRPVIDAAVAR
jgi:hypothetical protein